MRQLIRTKVVYKKFGIAYFSSGAEGDRVASFSTKIGLNNYNICAIKWTDSYLIFMLESDETDTGFKR